MVVEKRDAKTGQELLERYFRSTADNVTLFSHRLGVSRQTVHGWLSGTMPSPSRFEQIERETQGAVPPRSWYAAR